MCNDIRNFMYRSCVMLTIYLQQVRIHAKQMLQFTDLWQNRDIAISD